MADDSINLSLPSLQLLSLDSPEKLSPKSKKEKGKIPSKVSKASMNFPRSFPDGDSIIVKQKPMPISPSSAKKKKKPSPKKTDVKIEEDSDANEMDVSWEKAVEAARGLPEGAESSDKDLEDHSEEMVDGKTKPKKKGLKVSAARQ
jgi:hypothetical protein